MSKILNQDVSILGSLSVNPDNATGKVLTLDVTNKVAFRTIEELAADGADKHYTHLQGAANSVWTIAHNLGKKVSAIVVDSAKRVVVGQIDYIDDNNLTITFNGSFSGEAYLN
jgi:hypothetical protein